MRCVECNREFRAGKQPKLAVCQDCIEIVAARSREYRRQRWEKRREEWQERWRSKWGKKL